LKSKPPNPPLTLIASTASGIAPPRALGPAGRQLWDGVMAEYDIRDRGGVELLCLAAETLDRVGRLAAQIDTDGEIIEGGRNGPRAHPALREELAGRAFVAKVLERLGLNVEPIKPMGRPPRAY
jgi:hypothetical protein